MHNWNFNTFNTLVNGIPLSFQSTPSNILSLRLDDNSSVDLRLAAAVFSMLNLHIGPPNFFNSLSYLYFNAHGYAPQIVKAINDNSDMPWDQILLLTGAILQFPINLFCSKKWAMALTSISQIAYWYLRIDPKRALFGHFYKTLASSFEKQETNNSITSASQTNAATESKPTEKTPNTNNKSTTEQENPTEYVMEKVYYIAQAFLELGIGLCQHRIEGASIPSAFLQKTNLTLQLFRFIILLFIHASDLRSELKNKNNSYTLDMKSCYLIGLNIAVLLINGRNLLNK